MNDANCSRKSHLRNKYYKIKVLINYIQNITLYLPTFCVIINIFKIIKYYNSNLAFRAQKFYNPQ